MKVYVYRIVGCNQNNYHSRSSTSSAAAETFILIRKVHFCWTFCDLYPVSGSCYGHQKQQKKLFSAIPEHKYLLFVVALVQLKIATFELFSNFQRSANVTINYRLPSGFEFHRKVTNWRSFINEWVGRVTERKGNLVHYSGFRKKQARAGFDR